jgi:hypothetical protein
MTCACRKQGKTEHAKSKDELLCAECYIFLVMHRDTYLKMPLNELLRACKVSGFQGGGPGGQFRNKTNSGVDLRLSAFNLAIKSCESRSASENKVHALHRMRLAIALNVREAPKDPSELKFPGSMGHIQPSNAAYPQFIADVLDIVAANGGDTKEAARAFDLTPSALTKILHADKAILAKIQELRRAGGKPDLRR